MTIFPKCISIIGLIFLLASCEKVGTGKDASSPAIRSSGTAMAGGAGSGSGGSRDSSGLITAGEWNDIDNWNFWTGLMDTVKWKDLQDYWKLYPANRFSIHLTDQANNNLADAIVTITDGTKTYNVRTDNFGKAECFPGFFTNDAIGSYSIITTINGKAFDLGSFSTSVHAINKQVNLSSAFNNKVDIMFVVDATGSMGDEIQYLQNELENVIVRSQAELPGLDLREGSVFYRDIGDSYVTKIYPFSADVNSLITFIKAQKADGGGDFPESMELGLKAAIEQQNWSTNAVSRLLFLVLDAPPHHEDNVIQSLKSSIIQAQAKGIKIIPVTASGIDKETEFLMRFMAIGTNGTYVFITNDSGIGNDHLVPTVGSYKVEYLNNLMIRLIKKYSKK